MSKADSDSQFAFPGIHEGRESQGEGWIVGPRNHPGMTLRDYFAAAALTGMLVGREGKLSIAKEYGEAAYAFADGMLAARQDPK